MEGHPNPTLAVPAPDPARWQAARRLLDAARERPAGARAAFLDAATDDDALRAEVAALLAADAAADTEGFLGTPAADRAPALFDGAADAYVGRRAGPWRLEARLGEGGMGVVYRATREGDDFQQTAALKLVGRGLAPGALVARFRQERRILARLEHPNIARLLDGGVTADGQPYFAMELVRGEPLTAYAEARALGVPERLRLFLDVCEAVAYAHRGLVVHRDLKPSNVVVAEDLGSSPGPAGRPVVKLLDFGIAKLLNPAPAGLLEDAAAEAAPLTQTGALMTPAYAAPEQVRGEAVTTATDVYALGVLLYELLAGRRPYEVAPGAAPAAVERVVCEAEPPPPSQGAPAERARRLRGDLDTVVLKALEKEPARRYPTADALADDLRRHLAGLPVAARRATAAYRAHAFVRRHPVGVGLSALAVLALLLGMAGTTWQARVAAAERDRAQSEAERAAAVTAFLVGTFAAAAPDVAPGDTLTAIDVLERGALDAETRLSDQPVAQAEVFYTIAAIFVSLGQTDRALPLYERALALRREHLGPDHEEVARTLRMLSFVQQRRGDLDAAVAYAEASVAAYRRAVGEADARLAQGLEALARAQTARGDLDAALRSSEEALAVHRRVVPPDSAGLETALDALAELHLTLGYFDEAEALLQQKLALQRAMGYEDGSPMIGRTLGALARVWQQQGDLARAETTQRRHLASQRHTFGPVHPNVLASLTNLGQTLTLQGRPAEAEGVLREALDLTDALFPDPASLDPRAYAAFGAALVEQGRYAEGEPYARRAVETYAHQGRRTALTEAQRVLAAAQAGQGRHADAAALYEAALAADRETLGARHPSVVRGRVLLAGALRALGQHRQAEPHLRDGPRGEAVAAGLRGEMRLEEGMLRIVQGRPAEAEPLLREAVQLLEGARGRWAEQDWAVARARLAHGQALAALGRRAEAQPLLTRAYRLMQARRGAADPYVREAAAVLAAAGAPRGV